MMEQVFAAGALHLSPFFTGGGRIALAIRVRGRARHLIQLQQLRVARPSPLKNGERERAALAEALS